MAKTRAFTLIEILIVLSIASILAAILFAALSHQYQNRYNTICQSNLKQIYLGFQIYLQDHDGRFPHSSSWSQDIAPYLKSRDVLLCPSLSEQSSGTTYGFINERINVIYHKKNGAISWSGITESSLPSTSNFFILMDGVGVTSSGVEIGRGQMLYYPTSCNTHNLGQSSIVARSFPIYHFGGGNYLFADGHVKWLSPEAALGVDCAAGNWRPQP